MPHIFPKRYLRNRDILDPEDLNQDFTPAQELIDGQLDATNFEANDFSSNVTVTQGAYFTPYYEAVECDLSFGANGANPRSVLTPNFVQDDGTTFRDHYPTDDGSTTPFVIPNNGAWVAVDGRTAGTALQVELTTGASVLWLTAYLQYMWQGFYEPKEDDVDAEEVDPDKEIRHTWPNDDHPYAFPPFEGTAELERKHPGLGGWHHRSRGGFAPKVQFALRVNGRVITRSITGKYDVTDAHPSGLKAGFNKAKTSAQKGQFQRASYDEGESIPGQLLPKMVAAGLGPEVMPVRLGAVVPVPPGTHTVELVARRLPTARGIPRTKSDYVGVFTRRVLCLELPNTPPVVDGRSSAETIPDYDTEILLDQTTLHDQSAARLRKRYGSINSEDILRHSLPSTHLPSKVAYTERVTINPETTKIGRLYWSKGWSRARWPGWRGGVKSAPASSAPFVLTKNPPDHVVSRRSAGWTHNHRDDDVGNGWYMLDEGTSSGDLLRIVASGADEGKLNVADDEMLVVQADVFLRGIVPVKSDYLKGLDPAVSDSWEGGLSYDMAHKYLDIFSAFAIGYYDTDQDKWIIASEFRPAWVNHFNWFGRTPYYLSSKISSGSSRLVKDPSGDYFFSETEEDLQAKHDQIFTSGGSWEDWFDALDWDAYDFDLDARGGATAALWQFCNIPLFLVIDSAVNISQLAVFCCSTAPGFHFTDGGADFSVPPRNALKSVRTYWGRSSLMALKLKL